WARRSRPRCAEVSFGGRCPDSAVFADLVAYPELSEERQAGCRTAKRAGRLDQAERADRPRTCRSLEYGCSHRAGRTVPAVGSRKFRKKFLHRVEALRTGRRQQDARLAGKGAVHSGIAVARRFAKTLWHSSRADLGGSR